MMPNRLPTNPYHIHRGSARGRGGACRAAPAKRLLWWLLIVQLACLLTPVGVHAAEVDQDKLTKLKAAYLYNLLKFTHWPEGKFADDAEPIRVLIVGKTPVAEVFASAVKDHEAQNRSIRTERVDYPPFPLDPNKKPTKEQVEVLRALHEKMRNCHMVFFAEGMEAYRETLLTELHGAGALTVSDMDRFAEDGGMVALALNDKNRLGFVVNLDAVEASNLKLSSSLLKLAEVVRDGRASVLPITDVLLAVCGQPLGMSPWCVEGWPGT